jgi:hypothetical protein
LKARLAHNTGALELPGVGVFTYPVFIGEAAG